MTPSEVLQIWSSEFDIAYEEGVFVGYRWYESKSIEPLYSFGYGLSYTTYEYSNLVVERTPLKLGSSLNFTIDIENTGDMDGQEIVQVYVRDIEATVPRPLKELKGFEKVALKVGVKLTLEFTLVERDFAYWDTELKQWKVEPGQFEILVGTAANNIMARTVVELIQ